MPRRPRAPARARKPQAGETQGASDVDDSSATATPVASVDTEDTPLKRYATRRAPRLSALQQDRIDSLKKGVGNQESGTDERSEPEPEEDADRDEGISALDMSYIPPGLRSGSRAARARVMPHYQTDRHVVRPPAPPDNVTLVKADSWDQKIGDLLRERELERKSLIQLRRMGTHDDGGRTTKVGGRASRGSFRRSFTLPGGALGETDEEDSADDSTAEYRRRKQRRGGGRSANLSGLLGRDYEASILLSSSEEEDEEFNDEGELSNEDLMNEDDEFLQEHEFMRETIPPKKKRLSAASEGRFGDLVEPVKNQDDFLDFEEFERPMSTSPGKRRYQRRKRLGISLRGYAEWRKGGNEPPIRAQELRENQLRLLVEVQQRNRYENPRRSRDAAATTDPAYCREACRVCGLMLCAKGMGKHTQAHRKYIWVDAKGQLESVAQRACDQCRLVFNHPGLLYQHKASIHSILPLVNCTECGEQFDHRHDLIGHLKAQHLGLGDTECCLCLLVFPSKITYASHMVRAHNIHEPRKERRARAASGTPPREKRARDDARWSEKVAKLKTELAMREIAKERDPRGAENEEVMIPVEEIDKETDEEDGSAGDEEEIVEKPTRRVTRRMQKT